MLNRPLDRSYSVGAQGSDVVKIQQALQLAGFSPGPIDGKFGTQTKTAVQSFQSAQQISVDGIVGPLTWVRLLSGAPAPGEGPPTITLPAPTPSVKPSIFGMPYILGLGIGLVVYFSMKKKRRGRR